MRQRNVVICPADQFLHFMVLQRTYLSYNRQLYTHYHLCHYLPAAAGKDDLSHSLLKFKKSRQPDLEEWTDRSLELFEQADTPHGATIIRAFHHYETIISPILTALDHLGHHLAARFHHKYHPELLQKAHVTAALKIFSKPRREEELQGLYHISPSIPPTHWLIIDDILTSGATIRSIIQAIHHTYPAQPAPIDIFTLAKTITTPPLLPF